MKCKTREELIQDRNRLREMFPPDNYGVDDEAPGEVMAHCREIVRYARCHPKQQTRDLRWTPEDWPRVK